jgi:hypothetical protein
MKPIGVKDHLAGQGDKDDQQNNSLAVDSQKSPFDHSSLYTIGINKSCIRKFIDNDKSAVYTQKNKQVISKKK